MYQIDWASSERWSLDKGRVLAGSSRLNTADVSDVMLIQWQEHRIECAVPLCYETCSLFSTFDERLAAKAHWDGTMELMRHSGNALTRRKRNSSPATGKIQLRHTQD